MQILTTRCPCCNEEIEIAVNENNTISINHKEVLLSENEQHEIAKQHGIEFG